MQERRTTLELTTAGQTYLLRCYYSTSAANSQRLWGDSYLTAVCHSAKYIPKVGAGLQQALLLL